ncbi:MAG TPA: tetratricopeptide repeat protein [Candidatus Eisenbacteria bacterium]|nr:tetratricopeptide repeat protein [Candidatus Eisenbacteria bacterium]
MTKEDLYQQGMEFFSEGKLEQAIAAYEAALERDPNYAEALHALAMTYARAERLDEAIATGKKLVELAPNDELAYTSLSLFFQQKGMIAEAESVAAKGRTLSWKRQLEEKKETKED